MKSFFNFSLIILVGLSTFLVGCNTVRGIGQDLQAGGHELQRAATR